MIETIAGSKNLQWSFASAAFYKVWHSFVLQKEYARYKQAQGWRHLVVYKSGIHALGLYTSQFISRGAMVINEHEVQFLEMSLAFPFS